MQTILNTGTAIFLVGFMLCWTLLYVAVAIESAFRRTEELIGKFVKLVDKALDEENRR